MSAPAPISSVRTTPGVPGMAGAPGLASATGANTAGGQGAGLFIGSWEIGTMLPGAPLLTVNLALAAPTGIVTGLGKITQATNPPLDVASKLDGDYTYLTVMPDASHILVTITGYPILNWPAHVGIGPVVNPNLSLRMVLDSDWQRGTATFSFQTPDGNWQKIESATAHISHSVHFAGRP
jgi:Domain of unknown function (DUF1842)